MTRARDWLYGLLLGAVLLVALALRSVFAPRPIAVPPSFPKRTPVPLPTPREFSPDADRRVTMLADEINGG